MIPIREENLPVQANEIIVSICKEKAIMQKAHEKEREAMSKRLWDAVHAQYPNLSKEGKYALDTQHIKLGIVILENSSKGKEIDKILKKLMT